MRWTSKEQKRAYERAYRAGPYKGKGYKKSGWALHLRKSYGLTVEQYEAMRAAQLFSCKICGEPEWAQPKGKLHVDHCHATNKVRGLLCDACNRGIGVFKDSPALLVAAANYLKETSNS